jgi:hypothetical protein
VSMNDVEAGEPDRTEEETDVVAALSTVPV